MTRTSDSDDGLYAEGYRAGGAWANGRATKGELRRLEGFDDGLLPLYGDVGYEAMDVVSAIAPGIGDDDQAAREYWEGMAFRDDTDACEAEFVHGFVKGALGR